MASNDPAGYTRSRGRNHVVDVVKGIQPGAEVATSEWQVHAPPPNSDPDFRFQFAVISGRNNLPSGSGNDCVELTRLGQFADNSQPTRLVTSPSAKVRAWSSWKSWMFVRGILTPR